MAVALRARQLVKRANPFVHPKKSSWQRRGNGATIRKYGVEMVSETPPTEDDSRQMLARQINRNVRRTHFQSDLQEHDLEPHAGRSNKKWAAEARKRMRFSGSGLWPTFL